MCEDRLPDVQSELLLTLRQKIRALMAQSSRHQSWELIGSLGEYCQRHRAESALGLCAVDDRWPAHVDFKLLRTRLEAYIPELRAVWQVPYDNNFYISTMLQVGREGMDGAFDQHGDFGAADVSTVG